MLIFATIAIDVAAIAIWSATYGVNGFKEVGKLLRGEAAFLPPAEFVSIAEVIPGQMEDVPEGDYSTLPNDPITDEDGNIDFGGIGIV